MKTSWRNAGKDRTPIKQTGRGKFPRPSFCNFVDKYAAEFWEELSRRWLASYHAAHQLVIGVVCALISLGGMLLGARLGRTGCVRCWAGAAGGIALLGIGVRILYEHGVFTEMFGG